jgi:two-component system chemotaxis response regulator CheY
MKKVLLIEDNVDISEIYCKELKYRGYDVKAVYTGKNGEEAFASYVPDLTILDLTLPDMSGVDVLKYLKGSNKLAKIVVLTNLDVPAVVNEVYAAGADGYIIKSQFLPSQIVDEVSRYL